MEEVVVQVVLVGQEVAEGVVGVEAATLTLKGIVVIIPVGSQVDMASVVLMAFPGLPGKMVRLV